MYSIEHTGTYVGIVLRIQVHTVLQTHTEDSCSMQEGVHSQHNPLGHNLAGLLHSKPPALPFLDKARAPVPVPDKVRVPVLDKVRVPVLDKLQVHIHNLVPALGYMVQAPVPVLKKASQNVVSILMFPRKCTLFTEHNSYNLRTSSQT